MYSERRRLSSVRPANRRKAGAAAGGDVARPEEYICPYFHQVTATNTESGFLVTDNIIF